MFEAMMYSLNQFVLGCYYDDQTRITKWLRQFKVLRGGNLIDWCKITGKSCPHDFKIYCEDCEEGKKQ